MFARPSTVDIGLEPLGFTPACILRGTGMEKTLAEINADIASLPEHAAKYRRLADERRAVDQRQIAMKLMELVAELEAKAAQMEAAMRQLGT
jgi:hypothetical protein